MKLPELQPQKPKLQDFGIEPDEYALYRGTQGMCAWVPVIGLAVIPLVVASIVFVNTRDFRDALIVGVVTILPAWIVGGTFLVGIEAFIRDFKRSRLLKSPVGGRIGRYEAAKAAYPEILEDAGQVQVRATIARRQETSQVQIGATIARRQEARRVQRMAERKKREEVERAQLKTEREQVQLKAPNAQRQAIRRAQQETERKKREETERAQQKAEHDRKLIEHWMSLSGTELEAEMATLCRALGYRAETTPLSEMEGQMLF